MPEISDRLIQLLDYIEQVEKLKRRPTYVVPEDFFVPAYQADLKGLPGIEFNLQMQGDDIWLQVPRLREISAPVPDERLRPWVVISKSPDKPPELRNELVVSQGTNEVERRLLRDHPAVQGTFDWYVRELWEPWATSERPRRKTIALYNKLFALQQAIATDSTETPLELVWGIGYACWKKDGSSTAIRYPLLSQSCEISLNEKTFDLQIRPREVDAHLETDCYADLEVPGVRQLEAFWKSVVAAAASRVNPFESSTFEGVLMAAAGHLDPNGTGIYVKLLNEPTIPTPTDKLCVTDTWVLYGRRRAEHIFLWDVQRLRQKIASAESIPPVIAGFVETGDSTVRIRPPVHFRGLSSSVSGNGFRELYFPMPYNEEQVSIVEKLETNDGVVIQGPPGTGKTHTIANVICHFLAQGKRVLVTSKGESALAVLQGMLPERIRPLSVALLSDERDGMKQFEHSIQAIASGVNALNPNQSLQRIVGLDERLNELHAQLSALDRDIGKYAEKHMRRYRFHGRDLSPVEMAKFVIENTVEFEWLDDEPKSTMGNSLPFGNSDIVTIRESRRKLGKDISYLGCEVPVVDSFPIWDSMLAVHKDLVKARGIDKNVADGKLINLVDGTQQTFERAQQLMQFLQSRQTLHQKIEDAGLEWIGRLRNRLTVGATSDPALPALRSLCLEIASLDGTRRKLLPRAVSIPEGAETNTDFVEAVDRLTNGKSAFVLPLGKREARTFVGAVAVAGLKPQSADDWKHVFTYVRVLHEARKLIARWNAIRAEFELPLVEGTIEQSLRTLALWQTHIRDLETLVREFDSTLEERIRMVFGSQVSSRLSVDGKKLLAHIATSLSQQVDKGRLGYAMQQVSDMLSRLDGKSGLVVETIRNWLGTRLGSPVEIETDLQNSWHELMAELKRVSKLQGYLSEVERVAGLVETAGAPRWAKRLRSLPASEESDVCTPAKWLEAWNWRRANSFLQQIDGHHRLRELFERRRTLEEDLAKTYQDLVAEKTWLGVFKNSPSEIRQALQAYLNAIQAMRAGRGVRAVRFRKNAREAMTRAYKAVPCWVLPQWRVSETIPPEIGLFDLVVIDEASQSDIWALPALLRGQKILVVGDHKQVSPSAVGVAEEKIKDLVARFLRQQPHGAEMTPDKSIYDLARVVFAGNSVMLREHFRCVPAIIEYSNREFYNGEIKPLRIAKASERLDPPLIDVFVKGGFRKGDGDVNPPEAKAVIEELKGILADPRLTGRSIGIVTLLGTDQAAHISKLVNSEISPHDVVERKIAIGPPPVFQGRERDIMLISTVLAPGDRAIATRLEMEQRFNVAMSRARDRMYLFRSVDEADFNPDSLTARLLRHFRHPFTQDAQGVAALRERCESDFEREMFDLLTQRNFRVEPQVKCAGYRIDFVVEGSEGRRVAIECDGDRFHGPGQWMDDMVRQRVLERAGWTFWRCFASSFVMRKEEVVKDLMETLDRMGIEPLGAESVDNTVWVQQKEVDPYATDNQQAEDAEVA